MYECKKMIKYSFSTLGDEHTLQTLAFAGGLSDLIYNMKGSPDVRLLGTI